MNEWDEWVGTRPESVQKLAEEFPIPMWGGFLFGGKTYYLIGYTEDDQLIVSQVDPRKAYVKAVEQKEYICAEHLRQVGIGPQKQ